MQADDHRGTLGTVRNATLLLALLAEGPAYNQLTDLAERSGMSLPTVHRLLRSLALAGLVEQDPRSSRYSLGPEIVRLSERYLDRLPTLRALSPPTRPASSSRSAAETVSSGFFFAPMMALMEGSRGVLIASETEITAGSGASIRS